jgi:hypothetical protein
VPPRYRTGVRYTTRRDGKCAAGAGAHPLSAERRRRATGLGDIVDRLHELPVLDERAVDEIIGCDEHRLPT